MIRSSFSALLFVCFTVSAYPQTSVAYDAASQRAERHATLEWQSVADHLPNPTKASPDDLLTAADVLRARRMPEDAIEYYRYAIDRGGDQGTLWNRIGITELQINQTILARLCFKRALSSRQKSGEAWNNLGATEMISGNNREAIHLYHKAIKFQQKNATFHANLGTAYFAVKDYDSARTEYGIAVKLDPGVLDHDGLGGTQVHVLSGVDRGRFAFEMARLAASQHSDAAVLEWLAKALEGGFNVRSEMSSVKELEDYRKDPRVLLLLQNANAVRGRQMASKEPIPALPPENPASQN